MSIKIFDYEEYCKNVDTISYEEIANLLRDQKEQKIISFRNCKHLITGKQYTFVDVRNISKDTFKEYLSPDQNDEDIENNLGNVIEALIQEPHFFETHETNYSDEFICVVGDNYVSFPNSIAKKYVRMLKR